MKAIKLSILLLLILLVAKVNSQTVQIDNYSACNGDTIQIPIRMAQLDTIGAISLFIKYDTTSLSFVEFVNQATWSTGTVFNDMHLNGGTTGPRLGKIAISWTSLTGAIINTSQIYAKLKFKVIGSNSLLHFVSGCEIADYNANIITVNFLDGLLTVTPPVVVTQQPQGSVINYGESTKFIVQKNNANATQWYINQGSGWIAIQPSTVFSGYSSDTLKLTMPGVSYNNSYFRARFSNDCSVVFSDSVKLNVVLSINDLEHKTEPNIKVYPNPFSKNVEIESIDKLIYLSEVNFISTTGTVVKKITSTKNNDKKINILTDDLAKGEYLIELNYTYNTTKKKAIYKTIKTY